VENIEEAEDVVPNYDSLSHTSAYYEKVNKPNPAYQQYRKQSESIPVSLMNPKYSEQTMENALYSGVAALLPDEDVPSTTISFMPGSETKCYEDETVDNALYSTTDDALYSSVDKDGGLVTGNTADKEKPAATVPEGADKEPPIYAVPVKKSSRMIQPGNDNVAKKPSGQWVSPEVDPVNTAKQQDSVDMSIFVSKSQTKLDSEAPNASPTNDTDNVFDDRLDTLSRELSPKGHDKLENRGSIMSTTSDDRDLLNPVVKLHGRSKISHPKPNTVSSMVSAAKAKLTPSPKVKRANQAKSTMPDVSKQPSDQASPKLSSHATINRGQQSQVKNFSQPLTKPPIGTKPTVDISLLQASPKSKPSRFAMATDPKGSGRTSNMQLHPIMSSQSQSNPLQPLKDRSSPRASRKGVSVDSALQSKPVIPVNPTIPQQGTSQMQLTQAHPTSQYQASPLQQLRAKSSPRIKPTDSPASQNKQITPANQVTTRQRKSELQLHPTEAPAQHQASPLQQLRAKSSPRVKPREISAVQRKVAPNHVTAQQQAQSHRSSIATETFSQPASLVVNKPTEKQRPKSAVTADETATKTADITSNTGTLISFKEKRKQEDKDLDATFKDFEDFLTTI